MWETRVQFPTRDTSRLGRKVARYYVGVKSKPMQKDFEIKPSVHAMWETRVQFPTRDTSRLGRKVARYEDRTTCSRAGRALEHVEHVVLNV
ncbi:unnamed protein product, partial [Iphiclides podalirius]